MNVTVATIFDNVTQEIIDSITEPDLLVVVVKSSPSWHLSVGVGIGLLTLLLMIITSIILIIEYKWTLDERNANQAHKDIALKRVQSVDSVDSVAFSISSERQTKIDQEHISLSIDSFFSFEDTDSNCNTDVH